MAEGILFYNHGFLFAHNIMTYLSDGQRVFDIEIEALQAVRARMDAKFDQACELVRGCQGRVVVTGMGKSGHIGHKIAASLASTGTPAFFVHPGEASHGDLGMITPQDLVIALSNSGTTQKYSALCRSLNAWASSWFL